MYGGPPVVRPFIRTRCWFGGWKRAASLRTFVRGFYFRETGAAVPIDISALKATPEYCDGQYSLVHRRFWSVPSLFSNGVPRYDPHNQHMGEFGINFISHGAHSHACSDMTNLPIVPHLVKRISKNVDCRRVRCSLRLEALRHGLYFIFVLEGDPLQQPSQQLHVLRVTRYNGVKHGSDKNTEYATRPSLLHEQHVT